MTQPNDRITRKEFYSEMTEVKGTLNNMNREMGEISTLLKSDHERLGVVCDDVENLKKADKGFTAIASGIGGGIGIIGSYLISIIKGE
jgi:hypothetical protein